MKKVLFVIFCLLMSLSICNAEKCSVVSGSGKDIGDEVSCAGENFYILSNDGENAKMLAKYNLLVGRNFYYVEFDQTYTNWSDANSYLSSNYEYDGRYLKYDDNGYYYGALIYNYISYDSVLQDETAIGAHGDEAGEPEFPEIGVHSMVYFDYYDFAESSSFSSDTALSQGYIDDDNNYVEGYIDVTFDDDSTVIEYLDGYKESLSNLNISINDIDLLGISDLNKIAYQVNGSYLPLLKWWYNWKYVDNDNYSRSYYLVGSLSDELDSKYDFLWSTTYWTKTVEIKSSVNYAYEYMYFVDTLGNVCNADACYSAVGAGIRPVVTISSDEIIYNVYTKTDGNGSIEAVSSASKGEDVTFKVTPNKGYSLKEVKVTTISGEVITFSDYEFTMPAESVLIEATFEVKNPVTVTFVSGIVVLILGLSLFALVFRKRIRNKISKYLT